MKVWVTGASGFIGSILVKELEKAGVEVLSPKIDVCDDAQLRAFVESNSFDSVVHLAAISAVSDSESDRLAAFDVNVRAVSAIAELLVKYHPKAHFIFPSTGLVYAPKSEGDQEIYKESDAVDPRSYYGFSKYLAEQILSYKSRNSDLKVTILRVFNHSHKSQRPDFFMSSVYHQLLSAKSKGLSVADIAVGNVDVVRDIGAIQDLIRALIVVIVGNRSSSNYNVFNLSSGVPKNLRALINELAQSLEMEVRLITSPKLVRHGEPKSIIGSNAKLCEAYGWSSTHSRSVEELVKSFLADI